MISIKNTNKKRSKHLFFRRSSALIIDLLILENLVLLPFIILIRKRIPLDYGVSELREFLMKDPELMKFILILGIFMCFISIIYFSTFEFLLSATPGKKIMKIKVVSKEKNIEFWRYLIRNIWLFIYIPIWIIELAWYISTKQRLTEKISKTYVTNI